MVELKVQSPCFDMLPLKVGHLALAEINPGVLTSVTPFAGQQDAVSDALTQAYGLAFPAPNRMSAAAKARAIWFGLDAALLIGPPAPSGLDRIAGITDQSDAWVCVDLSGPGHEDALARLVPVDMRIQNFPVGQTVRTLLGHMNASITRTAQDAVLILVFRSMAVSLVHDLKEAMEACAARG